MGVLALKKFGGMHKINEKNIVHVLIIKSGHNYYNQQVMELNICRALFFFLKKKKARGIKVLCTAKYLFQFYGK